MWLLLSLTLAHARPLVEVADFAIPRPVSGVVEREGPPGCAVHFEYEDQATGWTRFRHGLSVPTNGNVEDAMVFMPPHNEAPLRSPGWCGSVVEMEDIGWDVVQVWAYTPLSWRIVDGEGMVLTTFAGPRALDARPLAAALGALDDYHRGKADPACVARTGADCWTAFELWVYLEDWTTTHCVVDDVDANIP